MMTRRDFIDYFDTTSDAMDFEQCCLSIGDEFLPEYVRTVRVGEKQPDSRYWSWLIDQWLSMER